MNSKRIPVVKLQLAKFERLAKATEKIGNLSSSVQQIENYLAQDSYETSKLSTAARYVIWWLTQIETDVYDREIQINEQQNSFGDKICHRNQQDPTKISRSILAHYPSLLTAFNVLLDENSVGSKAKSLAKLQPYLDQIGKQIVILKKNVATQVKDTDDSTKILNYATKATTKASANRTGGATS